MHPRQQACGLRWHQQLPAGPCSRAHITVVVGLAATYVASGHAGVGAHEHGTLASTMVKATTGRLELAPLQRAKWQASDSTNSS